MKYIEVVLAKDRKGKPVTSLRMPVEEQTLKSGAQKVVTSYGRTVILDFKTMVAQYWFPGTPDDRRETEIHLVQVEK